MEWFRKACSREFQAVRKSGERDPKTIKWIVIHSTESRTARSTARYFAGTTAKASAHLVIDTKSCYRTLLDKEIPWGAPGANKKGFHIELAGFARWTLDEWMSREKMLDAAAYKAALRCKWYSVPARWVGPIGLKLGRGGLTTHKDCSDAFPPNDGHFDPGPGFPRDWFMRRVKFHLAGMSDL